MGRRRHCLRLPGEIFRIGTLDAVSGHKRLMPPRPWIDRGCYAFSASTWRVSITSRACALTIDQS